MKKKGIIIIDIIIAVLLTLLVVFAINYSNNKKEEKELNKSSIILDFNKYFNSEDEKIIYLKSDNDSYSSLQTPILESIADDYNIDVLTLNIDKLTDKELNYIINKLELEKDTPNIVVVKNNEVIDSTEKFIDGKGLVDFLIENKVLKEGSEYLAEKYLTIIDYDRFNELYNGTNTFIITLGQTTCSHCIASKPVLSYVAQNYSITINYIDLTLLNESEYESLSTMVKEAGYTSSIGTPLTLIIKDKTIVDKVEGEASPSKYIKTFTTNGIIK